MRKDWRWTDVFSKEKEKSGFLIIIKKRQRNGFLFSKETKNKTIFFLKECAMPWPVFRISVTFFPSSSPAHQNVSFSQGGRKITKINFCWTIVVPVIIRVIRSVCMCDYCWLDRAVRADVDTIIKYENNYRTVYWRWLISSVGHQCTLRVNMPSDQERVSVNWEISRWAGVFFFNW